MNPDIVRAFPGNPAQDGVFIAAHKGTHGGNIVQNTIAAFETALRSGAHILEVDAAKSTDGVFYAFHTGQEPGLIGSFRRLDTMSSSEIVICRYFNSNQCIKQEKINRLDDILEHFKHRCMINIDRGYFYMHDILQLIQRHGMSGQIIFKCKPNPQWLQLLETADSDILFMPIIQNADELTFAKRYNVNLTGAEVLFDTEESFLASEAFITQCHRENLLVWVNAITLDSDTALSAGHDDDTALLHCMDTGWGWLIDRGFDVIQTDWPFFLTQYIRNRAKR